MMLVQSCLTGILDEDHKSNDLCTTTQPFQNLTKGFEELMESKADSMSSVYPFNFPSGILWYESGQSE
jgi:hypothetical protein